MTKRMVRIEEIFVAPEESFTPDRWIESDDLQFGKTTVIDGEHWVVVEVKEPAEKRIRINTSVIELKGNHIKVFRKGEQVKAILARDISALELFERECINELAKHINK
mgnify:CR=1 FL=1